MRNIIVGIQKLKKHLLQCLKLAYVLLLCAFLIVVAPETANAYCCDGCTTSSSCCNIFCCNCDGPCNNRGCKCSSSFEQTFAPESPADRFEAVDADSDGGISVAEIIQWLSKNSDLSQEQIEARFNETDLNGNGVIEPLELDWSLGN